MNPFRNLVVLSLLLAACGEEAEPSVVVDDDADGVPADLDCDDADPGVTGPSAWYPDADSDGWGDTSGLTLACSVQSGLVTQPGDCDDAHADAYPGGEEVAGDGVDQDCDGYDLPVLACATARVVSPGDIVINGSSGWATDPKFENLCRHYNVVGGDLTIYAGESLEGLSCLCEVEGDLSLEWGTEFESLAGLDLLSAVGGTLSIVGIDDLTTLDGLGALWEIGADLNLDANNRLSDATALYGLGTIGGDVMITDNLSLGDDAAQALIDAIGEENISGEVTISGNEY